MKLRKLLTITLSGLISTQTVLGVTYKTAKSKYLVGGDSGKRIADFGFVIEVKSNSIDGYVVWFDENVVIPSTLA